MHSKCIGIHVFADAIAPVIASTWTSAFILVTMCCAVCVRLCIGCEGFWELAQAVVCWLVDAVTLIPMNTKIIIGIVTSNSSNSVNHIFNYAIRQAKWLQEVPVSKVHVSYLSPLGPRWAPCWPNDSCYQGHVRCVRGTGSKWAASQVEFRRQV